MRPKEQILQNPRLKIVQAWKSGLMGYLCSRRPGHARYRLWQGGMTTRSTSALLRRTVTRHGAKCAWYKKFFWGKGNAWCSETRALSCTDTACTCGKRTAQTQPRRRKGKNDGRFLIGAAIGFLAGFEEAKTERRYEDADEEPEIYRPIPMEHTHGGED